MKKWGIKYKMMCDGDFTEEDNINCLVLIDNGEFIYLKEEDMQFIEEANIKEYEKYIKLPSFWIKGKKMPKSSPSKNKLKENDQNIEW